MIEGREFLDVAVYLETMDGEAGARSRTGRVYYAAFLESRSFCEQHCGYVLPGSGREHVEVPRILTEMDPKLAVDLAFLRKHRNIADYQLHLSSETIRQQAEVAKELANRIIARLDQMTLARQVAEHSNDPEAPVDQ
ncbi:hypothetical protein BH20CHL3_BH20CHL3_13960 [soil metagenome]